VGRLSLVLLVGCYSPSAAPGSPCDPGVCPAELVCSPATHTCEKTAVPGTDAALADGRAIDGAADAHADAHLGAIRHVFVIVMTRVPWASIAGSASAPYINSLLSTAAHAAGYVMAPGSFGSSEPYNIWLEAGDNLGTTGDNGPVTDHQTTKLHLSTLLDGAGLEWKAYLEGVSGSGCPTASDSGTGYYVYHDPFVFFDDVVASAAYCTQHIRPFTDLATDLANGNAPAYSFIVPVLCNDMHDPCAPLNDPVAQGDAWLKMAVPIITGSSAFASSALFITWDYNNQNTSPIGMIVVSPFAKPGHSNTTAYDASSTMLTFQEILGVTPAMRNAATATDLSDLFATFP
jgi:hypothetical protein